MKKFGVYATTAVGATAVSMAFFGTGIAAADDYAGQTVQRRLVGHQRCGSEGRHRKPGG